MRPQLGHLKEKVHLNLGLRVESGLRNQGLGLLGLGFRAWDFEQKKTALHSAAFWGLGLGLECLGFRI